MSSVEPGTGGAAGARATSRACPCAGRAGRAADSADSACRPPAKDGVERLGELLAARVLEREDVNLTLPRLGHIHALHELEEPQVVGLGGRDDEGVRAVVGDDLRRACFGAAPLAARAAGARAAAALEIQDLVELVRDLARRGVVHGLDPELVSGAAHVDLLDDPEHPLDLGACVGDDDEVAGPVDGDVAVLRLELAEERGDVVRVHVGDTVHARHVPLLAGHRARGAVEGSRLRRDTLRVHDLEEAAVRDDGHLVLLEDGQERGVGLTRGDLVR